MNNPKSISTEPTPPGDSFFWFLGFGLLCLLVWRFTPLHERLNLQQLTHWGDSIRGHSWTTPVVLLVYGAGLLFFSHALLIWATVFTFPPWTAFLYAEVGTLVSGILVYAVGRQLRQSFIQRLSGSYWEKVSQALGRRGILTIIILHIFPIAPFSVLNLISGASHISFIDFVIGTIIGVTPGIIVVCVLGQRLLDALHHPNPLNAILLLGFIIIAWFSLRYFRRKLLDETAVSPH
jgi:uncharacterized membrane protein YdjX (TVP38/TMEM64 family)